MKTEKIRDKDLVLALIIRNKDWEEGLNFVTSEEDFLQVGFWGYNKGQKLKAHIHLVSPREVLRTQEVLFIKKGRLRADIYTQEGEFLKAIELRKGDTAYFLSGGHGYEILENNTQVLEVKNGPYPGPQKDKKIIN